MTQKTKNLTGLLLQIPLLFLLAAALFRIAKYFCLSFTNYDHQSTPQFAGVNNYISILSDGAFWQSLLQTSLLMLALTVSLFLCAVLPALLLSKIKASFGICVGAVYGLVSFVSLLPSLWSVIFSDDMYGLLNSFLMRFGLLGAPVPFVTKHAFAVSFIALHFTLLAVTFWITFIAAKRKKPTPGAALSLCSIPLLTFTATHLPTQGFLSDYFTEYMYTRAAVGRAYAILVLCAVAYLLFCALVCLATAGISKLVPLVKINTKTAKTLGHVVFATGCLQLIGTIFLCCYILITAFKPYSELFVFPPHFFVKNPSLTNFFAFFENFDFGGLVSSLILYSLFLSLLSAVTWLPSSIGIGMLQTKYKFLLPLSCYALTVLSPQYYIKESLLAIRIDYFLSGLFFPVLLFVGYYVIRSMRYPSKSRRLRIFIGISTLVTSVSSAAALSVLWCPYDHLRMYQGIAKMGENMAGSTLLLLATIALLFLPVFLLLTLYAIGKFDKKQMTADLPNSTF
ncbi:MAG: sugar ABC transporter permease [Clostridia bacterium]|nr:sugar ABC transporter permease [Clostridia bacterium]